MYKNYIHYLPYFEWNPAISKHLFKTIFTNPQALDNPCLFCRWKLSARIEFISLLSFTCSGIKKRKTCCCLNSTWSSKKKTLTNHLLLRVRYEGRIKISCDNQHYAVCECLKYLFQHVHSFTLYASSFPHHDSFVTLSTSFFTLIASYLAIHDSSFTLRTSSSTLIAASFYMPHLYFPTLCYVYILLSSLNRRYLHWRGACERIVYRPKQFKHAVCLDTCFISI